MALTLALTPTLSLTLALTLTLTLALALTPPNPEQVLHVERVAPSLGIHWRVSNVVFVGMEPYPYP